MHACMYVEILWYIQTIYIASKQNFSSEMKVDLKNFKLIYKNILLDCE